MAHRLTKQKNESARDRARLLHEQMLRENPEYRKEWEKVTAMFRTILADADIPDDENS